MSKKILSILISFGLTLILVPSVYAADLNLIFDNNEPNQISGNIFNETSWAPGQSVTKTIHALNKDGAADCKLYLKTFNEVQNPLLEESFASKVQTTITSEGFILFSGTLQELFDLPNYVTLTKLMENNGSATYVWTATFDIDAGNEYMNASAVFDTEFYCQFIDQTISGGSDEKEDSSDSTENEGSSSVQALVSPITEFFGGVVEGISDVISPEEQSTAMPQDAPKLVAATSGAIAGVSTCADPWWWFLIFLVQIVVHFAIKYFTQEDTKKHLYVRLSQLVSGLLFFLIFAYNFCPSWDKWVSLLIALIALLLTLSKRRK